MKKKIYFDNKIDTDIDFIIDIHGGKIRNFKGYNMHDSMLEALLSGGLVENGVIRLINIETKSDFTLEKLTKYDKEKFGIKANYRISSKEILQYILRGAYIKLNFFEHVRINFDKKETVFHRMKISEKIAFAVIISLPLLLIDYGLNRLDRLNIKSPNPSLKTINHDTIIPAEKAKNHSTKQKKLDLDTLSRR